MNDLKKKILQIAFNHLGMGGIQSVIMNIVRNLSFEYDMDIVLFSSEHGFYDEEFEQYGRIFRCPHYEGSSSVLKKIDKYIRYYRIKNDIKRIIQENGPYDVVHSHSFFDAAPCLHAAFECEVPVRIAHSHNTAPLIENGNKSIKFLLDEKYKQNHRECILKYSTHRVGCSRAAADYLFGEGKGQVILNCIDTERFENRNKIFHNRILRIINVGNFLEQKNQLFLVGIVDELRKITSDITVTLVGRDTPYKKLVLDKIDRCGLHEFINIKSYDSDIKELLDMNDFFLFPSNYEGLGMALIEAQAAGLYCFTSTRVTRETDCGLVEYLNLNDGPKVWADRIYKVFIDNELNNRKADISRFIVKKFIKEIAKIYSTS